jgi:hypothetical protein
MWFLATAGILNALVGVAMLARVLWESWRDRGKEMHPWL